jgi:hypothetical protein
MANGIKLTPMHSATFQGPVWPTADNASSIYSRPSVAIPASEKNGRKLRVSFDEPMIHALDHDIAAIGGSTMVLDTTVARTQRAKRLRPQSEEERRRELLWHQRENRFYETCFTLSHELCAAVDNISQKLQLQSYDEPEVDPSGNIHLAGCLSGMGIPRVLEQEASHRVDLTRLLEKLMNLATIVHCISTLYCIMLDLDHSTKKRRNLNWLRF